jgi:hypothetical protein
MKIIITESQMALIRRLSELEQILDTNIKELNDDIKGGGSGNKPDNFGVYERWVINRVENDFEDNNPNIEFANHDFMMLISGQFNNKIRNGFNKVKNKR